MGRLMKDEPRARFKSWKCPYYGPLTLLPPPSKDGIRYVVTEDFNRPVFFPHRPREIADFDWMK